MTNLSNAEYFVLQNLAAADESGTFEGSGNTVCDERSVVAAGNGNTIDGGHPGDESYAANSFTGAGVDNSITAEDAMIGAGSTNTVSMG